MLQKMRAGLAALGIFIGTSTVIWLVAMGEGVSYQAREQIKNLGATNIIVRSLKPNTSSDSTAGRPGDDRHWPDERRRHSQYRRVDRDLQPEPLAD